MLKQLGNNYVVSTTPTCTEAVIFGTNLPIHEAMQNTWLAGQLKQSDQKRLSDLIAKSMQQ